MADPRSAAARPIRSFVAIELAEPTRVAVAALVGRLRAGGAAVAWTRPENLHLTLKFLGEVEPERLERLGARLAAVAASSPRFTLDVRGCGAFPALVRPRVLWVAASAPEIAGLAVAVDEACAAEGFERERRAFHPHVTLGRVREGGSRRRGARSAAAATRPADLGPALALLETHRATAFGLSPADALVLFCSDLEANGARHTVLARWPLAEAPC